MRSLGLSYWTFSRKAVFDEKLYIQKHKLFVNTDGTWGSKKCDCARPKFIYGGNMFLFCLKANN